MKNFLLCHMLNALFYVILLNSFDPHFLMPLLLTVSSFTLLLNFPLIGHGGLKLFNETIRKGDPHLYEKLLHEYQGEISC